MKINYENSEERLNNLREWYKRRSAEFQSSKYLENKNRRSLTTLLINENEKYERKKEIEGERFRQEFENKMKIAFSKYQPPPKQHFVDEQKIGKEENVFSKYTRKINCLQLKPEDFVEFTESEEEDEEEEINENTPPVESSSPFISKNSSIVSTSFSSPNQLSLINTKENFSFNFNSEASKTINSETTFSSFSPQQKEVLASFPSEPISSPNKSKEFNSFSNSAIFNWLNYFNKFNSQVEKEVKEFKADVSQKELRQHLSRTLAERINDTCKKVCTTQEIALLSNFFIDLFEGKTLISCRDEVEFNLEKENKKHTFYAMMTICDRYIEQLKWEAELVDQTRLIIVFLILKQPLFYQVFCARIVASLVLFSFDLDKIITKLDNFGGENCQNNSALSHWISDEQITFKLFCKVQIALKSIKNNKEEKEEEDFWIKQRGPKLLLMIFEQIVKCWELPLCTLFVLEEMFKNHSVKSLSRPNPKFSNELNNNYIPLIKKQLLKIKMENSPPILNELKDETKRILISRQKYLICLLETEINKFEEKRTSGENN